MPVGASGLVTTTSAVPAPAGVVAVSFEALTNETLVAATPPNVTVGVATKLAPLIVTFVLPDAAPLAGETDVTAGAGGGPGGQFANLNVPMMVCQFQVPFALRYSFVYQKVQSSVGSMNIEL